MKLSKKPLLMSVLLTALVTVGCGQRAKSDDVAQNDQTNATAQTTTAQPAVQQNTSDASRANNTTAVTIDDSMITTKVKAAIVAEPTLSALDIKVKTNDGVVTLSGTIDTAAKAERAKQLAQTVDGVKTINNELVVKSSS